MSGQKERPDKTGGGKYFLRSLTHLFFVILIGVGIGIGLFYGISYLTDRYFQSVQTNTEQIAALETRISDMDQLLSDRMDGALTRLETLEVQSDTNKQTFSEMEGQLAVLETSVEEQQTTLMALQNEQENLAATLEPLPVKFDDIDLYLKELETEVSDYSEIADLLEAELMITSSHIETTAQQVEWLKVLTLLSHAQLYLSQNNLGLAQQQVESTLPILDQLLGDANINQATVISNVRAKIIAALDALPDSPLLAASELDSAWNGLHAILQSPMLIEEIPATEP